MNTNIYYDENAKGITPLRLEILLSVNSQSTTIDIKDN